jgi:ABC-type polysaccharide/polyol phosphate export permease
MYVATAERIIRARRGFIELNLAELWRYRELIGIFAWRDILLRYKQTFFGIAWAVLQPVITMVVFSVLFGHWAKFDLAVLRMRSSFSPRSCPGSFSRRR